MSYSTGSRLSKSINYGIRDSVKNKHQIRNIIIDNLDIIKKFSEQNKIKVKIENISNTMSTDRKDIYVSLHYLLGSSSEIIEFSLYHEVGHILYEKQYGRIAHNIIPCLPTVFDLIKIWKTNKYKYFMFLYFFPLFHGFPNHVEEVYCDIYSNLKTKKNLFPKYSSNWIIYSYGENKSEKFYDIFIHPNNNLRYHYISNLPKDFELNFLNVSKYYIIQYIEFYFKKMTNSL